MTELTCRCGKIFTPRNWQIKKGWGKFCSHKCVTWKKKENKVTNICIICKTKFTTYKSQIKNSCSKSCFIKSRITASTKLKNCETCNQKITPSSTHSWADYQKQKYCSHKCSENRLKQPRICKICNKKTFRLFKGNCKYCYHRTPYYLNMVNVSWHKRRAKQKETDITIQFLNELWEKTKTCTLCNKEMENHSKFPYGKHLDHKIPLCIGGKHEKKNVRYIHAICNIKRPKDESALLTV